jgi:hypothetical protein
VSLLLLFLGSETATRSFTVDTTTPALNQEVTITATLLDADGSPLVGKTIYFTVTGANTADGTDTTDLNGEATFQYVPTSVGTDTIRAQWGAATGLDLVSLDSSTDRVTRHDGFSATELDFFLAPGTLNVVDSTHDGDNIILATSNGGASGEVYRMVGFTSTVDSSLTGLNGLVGVAWDGTNLITAYSNGDIKKHAGFSSTVTATISLGAAPEVHSIMWVDGDLFVGRLDGVGPTNTVERYDGFSTSLVTTLTLTSLTDHLEGIAWDGDNLITGEDEIGGGGADRINKHSGFSDTITSTIAAPSSQIRGVTWTVGMEAETTVTVAVRGGGTFGRVSGRVIP